MRSFANALVNNNDPQTSSLLKTLWLSNILPISRRGWDALADVICNETTITTIYNSNHMLQNICHSEDNLPNKLVSNLRLNRNKNKNEVIRSKVLRYFMNGIGIIQDFNKIELKIWPQIIDMTGKIDTGQPVFYQLVRSIPSLSK